MAIEGQSEAYVVQYGDFSDPEKTFTEEFIGRREGTHFIEKLRVGTPFVFYKIMTYQLKSGVR